MFTETKQITAHRGLHNHDYMGYDATWCDRCAYSCLTDDLHTRAYFPISWSIVNTPAGVEKGFIQDWSIWSDGQGGLEPCTNKWEQPALKQSFCLPVFPMGGDIGSNFYEEQHLGVVERNRCAAHLHSRYYFTGSQA